MPTRAICICKDSSVRIVTPGSGDVLTSFLASSKQGVLDAAYAAADSKSDLSILQSWGKGEALGEGD